MPGLSQSIAEFLVSGLKPFEKALFTWQTFWTGALKGVIAGLEGVAEDAAAIESNRRDANILRTVFAP